MRIEIVSPESLLYSGEGDMLIAKTTGGEVGILKDHEPLLASLEFGEVRIYDGSVVRDRFAVYGGFMEMRENVCRVLSDDAEPSDAIDFQEAQNELEDVRARLSQDPDNDELERSYQRALVRAEVARPD